MYGVIVPIFICCVMPILIILILALTIMNKDKLRAKVLMKAIECSPNLDPEKLGEVLQKPKKTPLEILNKRLLYGCIFTLVGVMCGIIMALFANKMDPVGAICSFLISAASIAIGLGFLITYFITRKQLFHIEIYNHPFGECNSLKENTTDKENTQS